MRSLFAIILLASMLSSCLTKNVLLEEWVIDDNTSLSSEKYKASSTLLYDLHHMELHLSFDWGKSKVMGKATLRLSPYFYSSNELILDAKNMTLEKVYFENDSDQLLNYSYSDNKLIISLPKYFTKDEEFSLTIEYNTIPGNTKTQEGKAITDSKGLYFINPANKPGGFMPQIWSQGEPESNSMWFPTMDSPNQKMTQDIYLTVDNKYITLSNGALISSIQNEDGNRTDHWRQNKENAPYLTMIAIGQFEKIKDSWNGIDVDYYVEQPYDSRAKEIFGNTPEMLEFYSNKLGVKYPWDKYAQIVVREYVSGAMENTSAVIFGDFMYDTKEKLKGKNHEDIIAHELFHHWFGDLVTCESWANLPLNESFATYGEYLWKEYKYGQMAADYHLHLDYTNYLRESKYKKEDLIRFNYTNILDMFDNHSYAKGGRILHMLRSLIGEEAFFQGLKFYLEDNAYQTVEIHDLRIAMEKTSGRDLNWFFNQWFLSSGHPELNINYSYNKKELIIEIEQMQDLTTTPLYRLPSSIQFYTKGKLRREHITLTDKKSIFKFELDSKPELIDFDPDRILLTTREDNKNREELLQQFIQSNRFEAKYEAFSRLTTDPVSRNKKLLKIALKDPFWKIRANAIEYLNNSYHNSKIHYKDDMEELLKREDHPLIISLANTFLNSL